MTSKDWRSEMRHLCSCLFYPTDIESINLQTGNSKDQGASNLSTEQPSRVKDIPWNLKPLYPDLANSKRNYPGSHQPSVVSKKKDHRASQGKHQTTDACKVDTRQLIPSKAFDPMQIPTWEANREATSKLHYLPGR